MSTVSRSYHGGADEKRRPDKVKRYKTEYGLLTDDYITDLTNIVGMVFSVTGLMMKVKWCAWLALICSAIGFANSRSTSDIGEDSKQVMSSFMLSLSAIVMSYLQNPSPMTWPVSLW